MEIIQITRHGVPFFFCGHPAWAGAAHGFSTRQGGVSPAPFDCLNLGANRGDTPGGSGRKSNQIFSPSLAVSFSEGIRSDRVYLFGEDWNGAASGKTIQYQRHHGRASFVFADGHGGMIRESQAMSVSANGVPNRMLKAGFK